MNPRVIKLDIDKEYNDDNVNAVVRWISKVLGRHVKRIIVSKSPSGRIHAWVHLNVDLSYWWRLYVALSLGDDDLRFRCNMKRYRSIGEMAEMFDLLFTCKGKKMQRE